MFKELEIMEKTLRYLLIAFAAMMISVQAAEAHAQSLAQEPQVGWQSTSSMAGSGSTLPQAVQRGTYTTYDMNGEIGRGPDVIKRVNDDDSPGTEPGQESPIGDGMWALMLFVCAYLLMRVVRKRTRV